MTTRKHVPKLKLLVGAWHLLKQTMAFGNPTAGGFQTMAEALWAVGQLNKELQSKLGVSFAVSAHWWHELLVPSDLPKVGYSAQWNNPRGIKLEQWLEGGHKGHYARPGRIIPPGFGLPGSDDGAFIHPDPARRQLAHDMMVLSLQTSDLVRTHGGEGHVIYWTGPDGIRWKRLVTGDDVRLGHELNPKLEEWRFIVSGVGAAVKEARDSGCSSELLIEGKPAGDPCYLDVFTDTALEIAGVKAIRQASGVDDVEWQGEFCHTRDSGQTFASAMEQAIAANVFGGRIHLNSGGLGAVDFSRLLSLPGGTPASLFPQYVDNDFLPGEGVAEWVDDQRAAIRVGAEWSAETGQPFEVEFDARFCRYADTIGVLERSARWVVLEFQQAIEAMS